MDKIKYPKIIDLTLFEKENPKPGTLYGLPSTVTYCKKCVISNQRPNEDCKYGGHSIAAVIGRGYIKGCQFHSEKSSEIGLKMLRRFCLD